MGDKNKKNIHTTSREVDPSSKEGWGWIDNFRLKTASLLLGMARAVKPVSPPSVSGDVPSFESDALEHWTALLPEKFISFLEDHGYLKLSVWEVIKIINNKSGTIHYSPRGAHEQDIIVGEGILQRIQEVLDDGRYISPQNIRLMEYIQAVLAKMNPLGGETESLNTLGQKILTIGDLYILGPEESRSIIGSLPPYLQPIIEKELQRFIESSTQNIGSKKTPAVAPSVTKITHNHYSKQAGCLVPFTSAALISIGLYQGWIRFDKIGKDFEDTGTKVLRILDSKSPQTLEPKMVPPAETVPDTEKIPPDTDFLQSSEEAE